MGEIVGAQGAEHEALDILAQHGELLGMGEGDPRRLLVEDRQRLTVQRGTALRLGDPAGLADQLVELLDLVTWEALAAELTTAGPLSRNTWNALC